MLLEAVKKDDSQREQHARLSARELSALNCQRLVLLTGDWATVVLSRGLGRWNGETGERDD